MTDKRGYLLSLTRKSGPEKFSFAGRAPPTPRKTTAHYTPLRTREGLEPTKNAQFILPHYPLVHRVYMPLTAVDME